MPFASAFQQRFTRRAIVFGGVQAVAFAALVGRLYDLQFLKSGEYRTLAEDNRVKLQLIAPMRGRILDCNGTQLALNQKNFRLLLELDRGHDTAQVLADLEKLLPLPQTLKADVMKQAKVRRFQPPFLLREHLTWEEVSKIEFESPHLPGVLIEVGQIRYYPFADKAAHLIGYVGAVNVDEIEEDSEQPLLHLPDFKIGKSGVEKVLEDDLRGIAGVQHIEVNVHGLPVRELSRQPSVPGDDMRITIDSRLQTYAADRMGEESGGAVVMDVHTGAVLAMASMPAFDSNIFSKGIPTDYWSELRENPRHPLIDKSIAGQFPPGSTFKMMTGLAALEEGVASADTHVFCPGYFMLGNHQFNCWKKGGHGTVNMQAALAGSCDTFFYTMAQKAGIDAIADMARRFGLGEQTGILLPNEQAGIVPDDAWKRRRYKQGWQTGDTVNAGIGQGYVLATPLQLAVMTARIANGGKAVKPTLFYPDDEKFAAPKDMRISAKAIKTVQDGMWAVTNTQQGTAYGKRIKEEGYSSAGKTGTSQVRKILQRGMDQSKLPWEFRHHALFVGYAPAENPMFAAAVLVEHGGSGASTAAPIANDILLKVQQLARADGRLPLPAPDEEKDE